MDRVYDFARTPRRSAAARVSPGALGVAAPYPLPAALLPPPPPHCVIGPAVLEVDAWAAQLGSGPAADWLCGLAAVGVVLTCAPPAAPGSVPATQRDGHRRSGVPLCARPAASGGGAGGEGASRGSRGSREAAGWLGLDTHASMAAQHGSASLRLTSAGQPPRLATAECGWKAGQPRPALPALHPRLAAVPPCGCASQRLPGRAAVPGRGARLLCRYLGVFSAASGFAGC